MIESIIDISKRGIKTFSIILIILSFVITTAMALRAVTRLIQHSLGLL